jgi:glycosyltransferase involved in cell wall biosynthesis
MTVSILIAAYQAVRFLPAALACVAAQTGVKWELIAVEDGSQDGTEDVVRSFAAKHPANRIVYYNLGSNRGVAVARNRLLELSCGEVVAFLDADDLWEPDHLASLTACLREGGHALACTPITLWDGDHQRPLGTYAPSPHQIAKPRQELFRSSFIMTSTCVALPRATTQRVGHFDESLRIGEDRDYWFRAVAGGGTLGLTGQPTARYTKHAGSSMTKTLRVAEDVVKFYQKHVAATDVPAPLQRAKLASALVVQGRLLRASEPRAAQGCFRRALSVQPWLPLAWVGWLATLTAR